MPRGSARSTLLEVEWGVRFWLMDQLGDDDLPVRRDSFIPCPLKDVTVEIRGLANMGGFTSVPPSKPLRRSSDAGRKVALDLGFFLDALEDGEFSDELDPGGHPGHFELTLTPASEDMRSNRPAGPGLGRTKKTEPNAGGFKDVMLRPLNIRFQLRRKETGHGFEVLERNLRVLDHRDTWPERGPHGQVLLRTEASGLQRLLVDWKPDWLRRTGPALRPLPFDLRPGVRKTSLIVIHNVSGKARSGHIHPLIGATLSEFTAMSKKKGIHYVVDYDGHIVKMTHESLAVKHGGGTGSSQWGANVTPGAGTAARTRFRDNINNVAIGIEHVLFAKDPGFPPELIRASVDLVSQLVQEFGIQPWNIVGHGEVNTDGSHRLKKHKFECPGNNFPWHIYELGDIVLTPAPIPSEDFDDASVYGIVEGGELNKKDKGAVREIRNDLVLIGYAVPDDDEFDETVRLAVNRFQARFMNGSRPWDYIGGPTPPGWTPSLTWDPSGVVDRVTAMQIKRVLRNVPSLPPEPGE